MEAVKRERIHRRLLTVVKLLLDRSDLFNFKWLPMQGTSIQVFESMVS